MKKFLKVFVIIILIIIVLAVITFFVLKNKYEQSLTAVNSEENSQTVVVEIFQGMSTSEIADLLQENQVIKNATMFKVYIRLNNVGNFQAGKYEFENGIDDVSSVCQKLVNGDVYDESVTITFVEGRTIEDYADVIAENTNNTAEEVLELVNSEEYIDSLIEEYWFITDEVKNEEIYYSLEGYILPDTYTFENEDVTVEEIFNVIFNYMDDYLSEYQDEIEESGYTVHELLSLASVVDHEGKTDEARQGIAGVFINRLNSGMSLGSDVTTYYAFGLDMATEELTTRQLNTENPYNTRGPNMEGKLPVGPICSPSRSAIYAVLNPESTDCYYFVADKNGDVYFSKTYAEHQSTIEEVRSQDLWYEY